MAGCAGHGSAGAMRIQSLGDRPAVLAGDYTTAYFSREADEEASFMLADMPAAGVLKGTVGNGQLLHIDLLWLPKPGRTPIDPSATNATIRLVVISNGEMGLYGGAGFAMPDGSLEGKKVSLTLRDASVQLLESTPGFVDLLSPAQMTGSFSAQHNDQKSRDLKNAASQVVTDALGKTRYVLAGGQSKP